MKKFFTRKFYLSTAKEVIEFEVIIFFLGNRELIQKVLPSVLVCFSSSSPILLPLGGGHTRCPVFQTCLKLNHVAEDVLELLVWHNCLYLPSVGVIDVHCGRGLFIQIVENCVLQSASTSWHISLITWLLSNDHGYCVSLHHTDYQKNKRKGLILSTSAEFPFHHLLQMWSCFAGQAVTKT